MMDGCPECRKLWDRYAGATTIHVKLEGKLQLANLEHDPSRMESLTREVEAAALERSACRESIRSHEASAHETGTAVD